MMHLPPEIISSILCHQPKTELKNARLVCKAFNAVATPFLFEDIFVIPRYADMEKSTLVASRFGSYVKTLIVSSEYFQPGLTWENFPLNIPDIYVAHSYYESYRRLEHEQEAILKYEFFGYLCSILTRLSSLQKVTLTDRGRQNQICWCQQAYVDGHSRTFDPLQYDYYPGLKSLRPPPKHNCVTSVSCSGWINPNIWPELLQLLYTSGNTKIKAIVTDFCRSGLAVSAFCMTHRQRYYAAKVLLNLTSLHLRLQVDFMDDVKDELFAERAVAQVLSAAINLTSLVIEFRDDFFRDEQWNHYVPAIFGVILEGCKMPRLVTFGLSSFVITETGMTTFLQHSQGIQHISFNNVKMTLGSWGNMFQSIKGNLTLKTAELKRLHEVFKELRMAHFDFKKNKPYPGVTYPEINKYLLGDGPNPFHNAALEHGKE